MIRRANTSITKAVYTNPDHVATYVKFGDPELVWVAAPLKLRSTRIAGRAALSSAIVVRQRRHESPLASPFDASSARPYSERR